MNQQKESKTFIQWSGGKDSALAYLTALRKGFSIQLMLTQSQWDNERVSMHGIHNSAIILQAKLMKCKIKLHLLKSKGSYQDYEEEMSVLYKELFTSGFHQAIGGDILLQDVKEYRARLLNEAGIKACFPIWGHNTHQIIESCEQEGIVSIICAVNAQYLDSSYIGKVLNQSLQSTFPLGMDPAGENGEYHTFVVDAPFFSDKIHYVLKDIVTKSYTLNNKEDIIYYFGDFDFHISSENLR